MGVVASAGIDGLSDAGGVVSFTGGASNAAGVTGTGFCSVTGTVGVGFVESVFDSVARARVDSELSVFSSAFGATAGMSVGLDANFGNDCVGTDITTGETAVCKVVGATGTVAIGFAGTVAAAAGCVGATTGAC